MCMFSGPVLQVSKTCIIVGKSSQSPHKVKVIYSNRVATETGNVMILPVNAEENTVRLVSTFATTKNPYPELMGEIESYYRQLLRENGKVVDEPSVEADGDMGFSLFDDDSVPVVKYGSYMVSITSDLSRVDWDTFGGLDDREGFFSLLGGRYPAHTFIIAAIHPSEKALTLRAKQSASIRSGLFDDETMVEEDKLPLSYEFFPRTSVAEASTSEASTADASTAPGSASSGASMPSAIVPTLHIHNGKLEDHPDWDHYIVCCGGSLGNVSTDHATQVAGTRAHFLESYNYNFKDAINAEFHPSAQPITITRIKGTTHPNIDLQYYPDGVGPLTFPVIGTGAHYKHSHKLSTFLLQTPDEDFTPERLAEFRQAYDTRPQKAPGVSVHNSYEVNRANYMVYLRSKVSSYDG